MGSLSAIMELLWNHAGLRLDGCLWRSEGFTWPIAHQRYKPSAVSPQTWPMSTESGAIHAYAASEVKTRGDPTILGGLDASPSVVLGRPVFVAEAVLGRKQVGFHPHFAQWSSCVT